MTMVINQEKCTGCGACVEACPNGAISLDGGVAVIDQAECSSCQVCADVCPEGALQFSKETVPATLQKIDTGEIIQPVTTIASLQKPSNWSAIALSLVGRYVLPRLVDILASFLEQRLGSAAPERLSASVSFVDHRPYRQRRRYHGRSSKN